MWISTDAHCCGLIWRYIKCVFLFNLQLYQLNFKRSLDCVHLQVEARCDNGSKCRSKVLSCAHSCRMLDISGYRTLIYKSVIQHRFIAYTHHSFLFYFERDDDWWSDSWKIRPFHDLCSSTRYLFSSNGK